MCAAQPPGPLRVAWRCWLVGMLAGYAVLIVACAAGVASAVWRGSGIARPAALVLLGVYVAEAWTLWRWAGQATPMLPPLRPRRYALVALVHSVALVVLLRLGWRR
jgi:hypothetical protein